MLRVSRRPSGRLEVIQLMRMMDDMLEKAGVDRQMEELTELSQMEGLLELVQAEQSIYNIVFHELIRQVSVGCAERGQLLAKLRERYQSLLERVPRQLKALHTETVAQRALDRRLTEEIHRIKTSIQRLNTELCRMRDHDASVSRQAERAHRQLAEALEQTHTNSEAVQGYHELYELHRGRLEARLVRLTEERDSWSQLTFCLALKVISLKKLQLIHRLHVIEQSWLKSAEQCCLSLSLKDSDDLNTIMEFTDHWREQLTAFMSQMKRTERAQCEQIGTIQQGIVEWLAFCTAHHHGPQPKHEDASLEKCHADMKNWSQSLALQCDTYQGETLLCCQQTLSELDHDRERWLNISLALFRRHAPPPVDGEPTAGGQQALRELDTALSGLLKQLDTHVTGESGVRGRVAALLGSMESQASRLGAAVDGPAVASVSDWLQLEEALRTWTGLAEHVFQDVSSMQAENQEDNNKPDLFSEAEEALHKVQKFITSMSDFTEGENQRLRDEVSTNPTQLTHQATD